MMEAWMHTHYSDYLKPYLGFNPVMTEAGIEGTEWWNNFFPHRSFVGILRALFNAFDKRQKSIWISGAYGTGKSHATLVIRKLLTDDAANVRRFCANRGVATVKAGAGGRWLFMRMARTRYARRRICSPASRTR